ncbi:MAG TPA: hypothetical protein VJV79_09735 [Polyangiaceae bacterium]|nr:hypothetical protein [Polyangiaceae bacterium]
MESSHSRAARAVALAFWALVLLVHGLVALAAWALLPAGFPLGHARFLANRALPALVLASVLGIAVLALRRSSSLPALLLVYPSAWFGLALAAGIAFPESGRGVALAAGMVALLLLLGLVGSWSAQARPAPSAWLAAPFSFALGAGFVLAQRAPEPSTRPIARAAAGESAAEPTSVANDAAVELAPWLRVKPNSDRVLAQAGTVSVAIEPRLAFRSRSPDRFWTVFAPARLPSLAAIIRSQRTEQELRLDYAGGGSLRVEASSARAAAIESRTWLETPIYSHLNAYARLSIQGHHRLGLRFSPCPAIVVEVVHSEYPFGAPARLAYLDEHGMFRVVQASDAEKGPFTTLAEGRLARGEPLSIELVELGEPAQRELLTVVFHDWSLQLSTELSPTAGWGLPQNALEFGRTSPELRSTVDIHLTLAGTSVGRGWDSVGHRAGVYTNRMQLRLPARAD